MSEWILTSEQLPEKNEPVLLIVEGWQNNHHNIYIGSRETDAISADPNDNFWGMPIKECQRHILGWSYFRDPEVKAWMPLPTYSEAIVKE